MPQLFAFITALIISLTLTPLVRLIGIRMGFMNIPGKGKVHTKPIPRVGGIAIYLTFLIYI